MEYQGHDFLDEGGCQFRLMVLFRGSEFIFLLEIFERFIEFCGIVGVGVDFEMVEEVFCGGEDFFWFEVLFR